MTKEKKYDTILFSLLYKGAFKLKKIYMALVVALMTAIIPMQGMAQTPQLTATNENGEVKVNITSGTTTQSVDELLPGINESTVAKTQEITLKAEAGVIASLRLEISEVPTAGNTTPLNNYNVTVTDADNNIVYNTATANQAKRNDSYKEIKLGELQANEEKTYSVTYSLIDSTVDVSEISVTLAAKTNVEPTPVPAPAEPTATLAPKFDFDSLDSTNEFIFDFADEFTDTESEDPTKTSKEIRKVCGKDIPAGRFSVTGNGVLKITSANGSVKNELVIAENPVNGNGVKTAVVLLETGDVLTITPLEGTEKARLKLNKVTTDAVSATATPVQPVVDTKTNPKTGDGNVGIVIGVALFAVLAFVGLEILKRRGKTNN